MIGHFQGGNSFELKLLALKPVFRDDQFLLKFLRATSFNQVYPPSSFQNWGQMLLSRKPACQCFQSTWEWGENGLSILPPATLILPGLKYFEFFVLKTKHPNLARLPIFVRYATIEQEWGQMLWHVEYYLFWLQLKAVFLNLVYFCCDTNATKAFLSRATVATGIIAVLPHRQQNCQTKISIIVYQKHNLRLCAHSCWSLEIFGSLDDH